ncbi:AAA family ATPase [Exiguobacterium sp. s133]|uniref:McrB family protein n=1 Tax=Exiguobacterium sp. s133 TaxID=2751213 RepID=UPI001BE824A8|nr:AAA family ATPase [Exiguobacterium sp. s133]
MTSPHLIDTPNNLKQWLEANKEFIDELKNKELTNKDTLNFYNKLHTSNIFGDKLFIRINKTIPIENNNIVIARVVEPTENGFQSCIHPLNPTLEWSISALSKKSLTLLSDELYECTYSYETHRDRKRQLITFNSNTLKKVDLTAYQQLQQVGGTSLAEVASTLYGDELDIVFFSKLFSSFEQKFKEELLSIEKREESLQIASNEIQEKQKQIDENAKELQAIEKELRNSHRKELATMNRSHEQALKKMTTREKHLYNILSDIRVNQESTDTTSGEESILHPWDVESNVETVQRLLYHNSEQKLYYDKNIIEMFLRALQTNTLVILSGPSGTGKSSLINAFAHALQESKASIIPVQSSWTDKQDLLGYFNTVEKRYVPTPFLEAVLAARESEGLHLICLDEMNLSHIEYYFAELLSAREQDGRVDLYPHRYRKEAIDIIEEFNTLERPSRDDKERYRNAIELMNYPAQLDIPKNVRFVGTINMDHTVKPLSPKVIDRSFIVELSYQYPTLEKRVELEANPISGKIEFDLSKFSEEQFLLEEIMSDTRWLVKLSDKLNIIPDAKINSRSEKQIAKYLQVVPVLTEDTLNQLIQSKILPRIHFSSSNEEAMAMCENFLEELRSKQLLSSVDRFEQMRKNGRYISYFK